MGFPYKISIVKAIAMSRSLFHNFWETCAPLQIFNPELLLRSWIEDSFVNRMLETVKKKKFLNCHFEEWRSVLTTESGFIYRMKKFQSFPEPITSYSFSKFFQNKQAEKLTNMKILPHYLRLHPSTSDTIGVSAIAFSSVLYIGVVERIMKLLFASLVALIISDVFTTLEGKIFSLN